MINFSGKTKFFMKSTPTDMRKGYDGLASIVRDVMHAKDTVISVEIEGAPTDEETDDVEAPPQPASKSKAKKSKGGILITIQTTDGLFVKKSGLD